jgi:hypothetical protein
MTPSNDNNTNKLSNIINDNNLNTINDNDIDNKDKNNIHDKEINTKKNISLKKEGKKGQIKMEADTFNRLNHFLIKKEKESEEQISSSSNSSQEKKPNLNSNDYAIEEIREIKPVIQHNIQRKRPVFTLPPDKKRCISQGKPFILIQKYYDENFILEDDEEAIFKKNIVFNGDSKTNSKEDSINSRSSLCNSSNRRSLKISIEDAEDNKNSIDNNNDDDEKVGLSNKKNEKERNIFKKISEEFYRDLEDDEFF